MRVDDLVKFILARHQIYLNRVNGLKKPWTEDKILQQYRFCNVYRELDKVTQWIATNWRNPHNNQPDLWFAMCVARLFNEIHTLENIGWPLPFNEEAIIYATNLLKADKRKVFNPAYIISTNGVAMDKVKYVVERILRPLWADKETIRPKCEDSLSSFASRLTEYVGFGRFLTGQVVADLKYVAPLCHASDWMTFALSGPGSRRGMNRVCGYEAEDSWYEETWYRKLLELQQNVNTKLQGTGMMLFHAQDLQNCLCEFDKYERARWGQGTPKQLYKGAE